MMQPQLRLEKKQPRATVTSDPGIHRWPPRCELLAPAPGACPWHPGQTPTESWSDGDLPQESHQGDGTPSTGHLSLTAPSLSSDNHPSPTRSYRKEDCDPPPTPISTALLAPAGGPPGASSHRPSVEFGKHWSVVTHPPCQTLRTPGWTVRCSQGGGYSLWCSPATWVGEVGTGNLKGGA